MRQIKRFMSRSMAKLFALNSVEGVDHLEDYLLRDIGLERVGGRVQAMGDGLEADLERPPLRPLKSEDPPM